MTLQILLVQGLWPLILLVHVTNKVKICQRSCFERGESNTNHPFCVCIKLAIHSSLNYETHAWIMVKGLLSMPIQDRKEQVNKLSDK